MIGLFHAVSMIFFLAMTILTYRIFMGLHVMNDNLCELIRVVADGLDKVTESNYDDSEAPK